MKKTTISSKNNVVQGSKSRVIDLGTRERDSFSLSENKSFYTTSGKRFKGRFNKNVIGGKLIKLTCNKHDVILGIN